MCTMAQTRIPQRWDGENQAYFVTVVTKGREPIFADEANCRCLMTACKEVFAYHPFRLAALVILPDHWHGILRPYPNIVIETVVGAIKQNVWRQMCAMQKRPSCWQPRFLDHRIRNDDDLAHHLEYMRQNPVKHDLTARPEEYPWLFFHPKLLG